MHGTGSSRGMAVRVVAVFAVASILALPVGVAVVSTIAFGESSQTGQSAALSAPAVPDRLMNVYGISGSSANPKPLETLATDIEQAAAPLDASSLALLEAQPGFAVRTTASSFSFSELFADGRVWGAGVVDTYAGRTPTLIVYVRFFPTGRDLAIGDGFVFSAPSTVGGALQNLREAVAGVGQTYRTSSHGTLRSLGGYYGEVAQSLDQAIRALPATLAKTPVVGGGAVVMDDIIDWICNIYSYLTNIHLLPDYWSIDLFCNMWSAWLNWWQKWAIDAFLLGTAAMGCLATACVGSPGIILGDLLTVVGMVGF